MRPAAWLALAALLAPALASALPGPAPAPPALACEPACHARATAATGPANEVSIAVNPRDPGHLLLAAKTYALAGAEPCPAHNAWVAVAVSRDGGRSWADALLPGFPGDAPSVPGILLAPWTCLSDPTVAFDARGRALLAGAAVRLPQPALAAPNAVWMAQSFDGGHGWHTVSYPALGIDLPLAHDQPRIATDPHGPRVHAAWTLDRIVATSRTDDGLAWAPPTLAPATCVEVCLAPFDDGLGPTPFVAPDGTVYVAYLATLTNEITVSHSANGGLTFEFVSRVAELQPIEAPNTPYRMRPAPAAAVDPVTGRLYVAWQDQRFGSPDIVLAASGDGGHTWRAPVRITDDPPGPNVQFFPALAVGPDSCVQAVWYDRRDDPANVRVGMYHSRSCDGGRTWSANLRVADPFDPAPSFHQNGQVFLGDYIGLAVGSDNVAHAAWTDTRTGRADIFTARILP